MNRRKLPFIFFILAILVWIGVVVVKTQTNITTIECQNCSEPALQALQQFENNSLFTVGEKNLENVILQHDFALHSFEKKIPGTLSLVVSPNPPVYAVQIANKNTNWKVTPSGNRIETTELLTLPLFILSDQLEPNITTYHQFLLQLLPIFETTPLKKKEVILLTDTWAELELQQNITLIFNPTQPDQQMKVIDFILKNWPDTLPKETQEIDLRFRLPVVRNTRSKPGEVWNIPSIVSSDSAKVATSSAEL